MKVTGLQYSGLEGGFTEELIRTVSAPVKAAASCLKRA